MDKFVTGEKVYSYTLKRNLIVARKEMDNHIGKIYLCIDPNLSMNEKRCGLFHCYEDRLESGWR
jgi:hypothetical protein